MIWIMYWLGLRPAEVCSLRWSDLHLNGVKTKDGRKPMADIHRVKGHTSGRCQYYIEPDLVEKLRKLRRQRGKSGFVFESMQGKLFTVSGVSRLLERAEQDAGIELKVTAGMLRNACGLRLFLGGNGAEFIRAWLGLETGASVSRYLRAAKEEQGVLGALLPEMTIQISDEDA
jgi:integrase